MDPNTSQQMTGNDLANYRNFKDFLMTYNKMTEKCFSRCVGNLNYRQLTPEEQHCVESCSSKLVNINHRMMGTFMEIQSKKQQAMIQQAEEQEQEKLKQAQILISAGQLKAEHEREQAGDVAVPVSEATVPVSETPLVDSTPNIPTTDTTTENTVS